MPRVLECYESSAAMPKRWPVAWFDEVGNGVIVKPLEGFNGVGVAVLKDASAPGGREYEARIAERLEALERQRNRWRAGRGDGLDVVRGSRPWRFIAEERLRHFDGGAVPADYKFYVFGGEVASVLIVDRNQKPPRKATVDADYRRVDLVGCVRKNRTAGTAGGPPRDVARDGPARAPRTNRTLASVRGRLRGRSQVIGAAHAVASDAAVLALRPPFWDEMVRTAAVLGAGLGRGAFVRVDLFATTRGVVLGEFTLQPHAGTHHCVVPWPPTGPGGAIDTCALGRAWRAARASARPPTARAALPAIVRAAAELPRSCRAVLDTSVDLTGRDAWAPLLEAALAPDDALYRRRLRSRRRERTAHDLRARARADAASAGAGDVLPVAAPPT